MHNTVEVEVWINRSPAEVFTAITDPEIILQYGSGMERCEQISDGPKGVGTRLSSTVVRLGRSMSFILEYTQYEPGRLLRRETIEGPMSFTMVDRLREERGGTRLKRTVEFDTKGIFAGLTAPLLRRSAHRNTVMDLETLKDLLEQEPSARQAYDAAERESPPVR